MTQAWAARIGALLLTMAPVGASVQTGLAVSRQRDGRSGIGVTFVAATHDTAAETARPNGGRL
jgi:hypothetical protein